MKKDIFAIYEEEEKNKVGRPRLASKEDKKKSLIFIGVCLFLAAIIFIFGYSTLFNFNLGKLIGSVGNNESSNETVLVTKLTPILKDINLKVGMSRKVYLTVTPANATNNKISYRSTNEKVVKVDEDGKVTALKEGNALIIATAQDGSGKKTSFNISVIKNSKGSCVVKKLSKNSNLLKYQINCQNAKIKEVQFKTDGSYKTLESKKQIGEFKVSDSDIKKDITLKVVYYPNNSKVIKYKTKVLKYQKPTKQINGYCNVNILEISLNSFKYDITCNNASVSNIAYKIGNGNYVGIDKSALADTIIFEESDNTRYLFMKVDYKIDGQNEIKTVQTNSVIQKKSN